MRILQIGILLTIVVGLLSLFQCEGNPKLQVSYSTDIDPIFSTKDCKL